MSCLKRSLVDLKLRVFNVTLICQKSTESFKNNFFREKYKTRSKTFINDNFYLLSFLNNLITKIGPKFQTLISNQALIQQFFIIRKQILPSRLVQKLLKNS